MALPKMDVPIGIVEWEVFVPEQYRARAIDGNVIDAKRFSVTVPHSGFARTSEPAINTAPVRLVPPYGVPPGQIRGRAADGSSVLPGVTVRIQVGGYVASVVSDAQGVFTFPNVPSGQVVMTAELPGFATRQTTFVFDGNPRRVELDMEVSRLQETITVTAEARMVDKAMAVVTPPSQNVVNLQARASGVLPIRVDVPRAGVSHQFVKPLVVNGEATVKLRYKRN